MAGNAWEDKHGIGRLAFLPALNPGAPPAGPVPPAPEDDPHGFLWHFRQHARASIDPELLQDRERLWTLETTSIEDRESWLTLRPDLQLEIWKKILIEELDCDHRSTMAFVTLVRKGHLGFLEGCRLLAHLFKDKDLDPSRPSPNASKWLKRAADEAMEAIDDPGAWDHGPQAHPSPVKGDGGKGQGTSSSAGHSAWGSYQPSTSSTSGWEAQQPGHGSSSSHSWGTYQDLGKGKGKGKWQGLR